MEGVHITPAMVATKWTILNLTSAEQDFGISGYSSEFYP
jgi:hypothetical protein